MHIPDFRALIRIWTVLRGRRLAGIYTVIALALIGMAALFGNLLLIGPFGYSYSRAYIMHTPADLLLVVVIPIAALAIRAVGISKRTVTKWATIPVVVLCVMIVFIVEYIIIAGL